MPTTRFIVTIAATTLALLAVVPAAMAKDGDIRVQGSCTRSSTSKLKLSDEDGRIEVEFEVDQNRNGVPWKVALRRNGTLVARTTARTRGPSGSFEVRRVVSGGAGADRIAAVATSPSGERCTAVATF